MKSIKIFTILILCALSATTAWGLNNDLSAAAKTNWQTYLAESPRDQSSKEFLYLRMSSFVANLEELQNLERPHRSDMQTREILNKISRDYQMLESTIRNLPRFDQDSPEARTSDLKLLSEIAILYGQARHLGNSD